MRNLLPIGRFSEICRLSIPALRHYAELGLLLPAAVDADTGYRYYSIAQAADAERIRSLRLLDMPLPEIKAVLAGDQDRARSLIEGHRDRLARQIERQQYAISLLESMLRAEPVGAYEIHLREVGPQDCASVTGSCAWPDIGSFVASAIGEVARAIVGQGIRIVGPAYTAYHSADSTEDELELEVGLPTDESIEPTGRVKAVSLAGGLAATTMHCGPYDGISMAYRAIGAWLTEHGHETVGPPRDIYLVTPEHVQSPNALRTEIAWPIR